MEPPKKIPKYADIKLNTRLRQAILDVEGGISIRKAAKQNNIKYPTLWKKIKKQENSFVKQGKSEVLTSDCNKGLKNWILDRADMGKFQCLMNRSIYKKMCFFLKDFPPQKRTCFVRQANLQNIFPTKMVQYLSSKCQPKASLKHF